MCSTSQQPFPPHLGEQLDPWAPLMHAAPTRQDTRLAPEQDHMGRHDETVWLCCAIAHAHSRSLCVAVVEGGSWRQQTLSSLLFQVLHQRQTGVLGSRAGVQHLIQVHRHGI
jgi:hypothetical protein